MTDIVTDELSGAGVPLGDDAAPAYREKHTQLPTDDADEDPSEALEAGSLTREQRYAKRDARRPNVKHLKPGTVTTPDGLVLPAFDIGDRIVAERCCSFLDGNPWLDTRVYTVVRIDDEAGVAYCYDDELHHQACIGFRHPHTVVRLAPKKGSPFRKRRTRPSSEAQPTAPDAPAGEQRPKRKRGRPKGSKNRPKEQIRAERLAKRENRR